MTPKKGQRIKFVKKKLAEIWKSDNNWNRKLGKIWYKVYNKAHRSQQNVEKDLKKEDEGQQTPAKN